MSAIAELAIVIVHYRVPELLGEAVAALRRDLASSGLAGRVVVVDNSGPELELPSLAPSVQILRVEQNLGYAGGINLGVQATREGLVLIMNPDVQVLDGCLGALVEELTAGADIAGPRLYWDEGRRLTLPPSDRRDPFSEILGSLAPRGPKWGRQARTRWRRHARRHWQASAPLDSFSLSGAMIAFRRSAWRRVGAFDTTFRLYFEETDWLRRAQRVGLRARYVPGAEALHLYNQSALREPESAAWFAASADRFRQKHHGSALARLLAILERSSAARSRWRSLFSPGDSWTRTSAQRVWAEVSPHPWGIPAAAEAIEPGMTWSLPTAPQVASARPLWIRILTEHGRELGRKLAGV